MSDKKVYVTLQNGKTFQGYRFGADGDTMGEVVFNTNMVGYIETLTDPNYYGQIVAQTFPMIGNYGVNSEDMESDKTHLFGYIVREKCDKPSNFRCEKTLDTFLKEQGVVGVYGVDTRELTKIVRENGAMNMAITSKPFTDLEKLKAFKVKNAVENTTKDEVVTYNEGGKYTVALYDLGTKKSLINSLIKRDCKVIKVPAKTSADEVLKMNVDGVMLSGGAGDPAENTEVIATVKNLLGKKPIFGVGLGYQILAIANGGKTKKMKYGHHGNQPVKETATGKIYISSHNHSFEVVDGGNAMANFINANDGSFEGIAYDDMKAYGVQFQPEAGGCNNETDLFNKFIAYMQK